MSSMGALATWLDAGVPGHWTKRYGIAVFTTAVALAIALMLSRVAAYAPLMVFAASVAITARYGGRGPSLLASVLSVIVIEIAFLEQAFAGGPSVANPWLRLSVFVVVALTISSMSGALHEAWRTAERQAQQLKEANRELEHQMEEVKTLSEQLQETNDALVTERDRAEALAERAQAAAQAHEEVLGVVAHDLRNPLNVVSMTTQLFLDIDLPAERRVKLLHGMQRATRQMNRLITDLLEVVRLESGRPGLQLRELHARDILMQAKEMVEYTAAEHGVTLAVHSAEEGLRVCADAERVIQVLGNLAGNAVKFAGRDGRVTLNVVGQGRRAVFSIADTGPGIAPEEVGRLFDRFWQARTSDRRGVGLGLTIARGIVEAHGGRIWVESRVGEGSTFFFALPAVRGISIEAERRLERAKGAQGSERVADDGAVRVAPNP